jgi:hypothetical protein
MKPSIQALVPEKKINRYKPPTFLLAVAQVEECLLSKCEALSSNPNATKKKKKKRTIFFLSVKKISTINFS